MKRKIIAILLCLFTSFSIMGCGKEEEVVSEEELTISNELKQNDYRGGLLRALSLKDSVMKIVDDMKANNKVIREDNPNSYWVSKNYQDFVNTMLTIPIIDDTQWFNEEETKQKPPAQPRAEYGDDPADAAPVGTCCRRDQRHLRP